MLLEDGATVREVYEVERFLGEGAFAEVYRVRHAFLGRQAMKVFKSAAFTPEETEPLLDEPKILSRMGHPNIIRVFDAGVVPTPIGECGYFTMEYVAGGSLEMYWRSHGGRLVPTETSVEIVRQVCRGLAVAHDETPPIIHRDVKPQNILVGYDAGGLRIRVSDFGLAKRANPLTLLASARGTREFKPPEFLSNVDSCAGDVWAIGSVLYLLLTDFLPYPEVDEFDFRDGTKWERPVVPPSRYNVSVDTALDTIVCRALALKPSDRYPNAKAMLADLAKWMPGVSKSSDRSSSTGNSKAALGSSAQLDGVSARKKLSEALQQSRIAARLGEAADLLEEALNEDSTLRPGHEYQLQLWRRGINM